MRQGCENKPIQSEREYLQLKRLEANYTCIARSQRPMDRRQIQCQGEETIQQSSPWTTQAGLCDKEVTIAKSTRNEAEWPRVMVITKRILDS